MHINAPPNPAVLVGDDTRTTEDNKRGFRFLAFGGGNVFVDAKVGTGESLFFRIGEGTETGAKRTWLSVRGSNGDVGLGTPTPTEKLDVVGTVKANGVHRRRLPLNQPAGRRRWRHSYRCGLRHPMHC